MKNFSLRFLSAIFLALLFVAIWFFPWFKNIFAVMIWSLAQWELSALRPIRGNWILYNLMLTFALFGMLTIETFFFLSVWFVAFVHDSSGYIFGKLLKGPKIAPSISPNKTWSGFLSGMIIISLLFVIIIITIYKSYKAPIEFTDLITAFFLGVITNALLFVGDLWQSKLKREYHIKDSGSIIPGHGGILDRFDAFLFLMMFFGIFRAGQFMIG